MKQDGAAPKISCVLPTYNGAHYLQHALDGLSAQEDDNFEVIIVDDCSTDETPAIVEAHCRRDTRFRTLRNSQNLKLPASLNAGFREARGQYLTWTSDDNVHEPEAFRVLASVLDKRVAVGMVYTDQTFIDDEGRPTQSARALAPGMLVFGNTVGASFLYRRDVAEQVGRYDETLFLVEDFDYWLRVSQVALTARLHRAVYNYRLHAGSLTTQRQQDIALAHEKALLKNLDQLHWLKPAGRACVYRDLAYRALAMKRLSAFVTFMIKAIAIHPDLCWRRQTLSDIFDESVCGEFDEQDKLDLDWTIHDKWKIRRLLVS
jgi:glycosyltransferase involved in cell wall biosynthesis